MTVVAAQAAGTLVQDRGRAAWSVNDRLHPTSVAAHGVCTLVQDCGRAPLVSLSVGTGHETPDGGCRAAHGAGTLVDGDLGLEPAAVVTAVDTDGADVTTAVDTVQLCRARSPPPPLITALDKT